MAINSIQRGIIFSALSLGLMFSSANSAVFTETSVSTTGVSSSSIAWVDYDNDGKLDLIVTGYADTVGAFGAIYKNGATWTTVTPAFPGVCAASIAPADFNRDGSIDLVVTGVNNTTPVLSRIYSNSAGTYSLTATLPNEVFVASASWGDYDNDGDLDLAVAGVNSSGVCLTKVYQNNSGSFVDSGATLAGVKMSSIAWGDYDNDGDLDLVVAGFDGTTGVTKLYKNNSGSFTEDTTSALPGVRLGSVAWGDYDNDGKLDLIITGQDNSSNRIAKLYRNTGSGFAEVGTASFTGVSGSSAAWGDYDNDGDLDIVIAGDDSATTRSTKVYTNNGNGTFTALTGEPLVGVGYPGSSVAWGDYDKDGKLDLAVTGYAGTSRATKIYKNGTANANTVPSTPTNLTMTKNGNDITFSWNASTDAQTPSAGLTYNIRVGTTSGAEDVMSGMANLSTGFRKVVAMGNVQNNTSWTLKNMTAPNYYFSVQAIDTAYGASAWAAEPSNNITVSGKVVLTDINAQNPSYTYKATFRIYKSGNTNCASPDAVVTANLDASGNYSFVIPPQGANCRVVVKPGTQTNMDPSVRYHWLAKRLNNVNLSANAVLADAVVANGDANDDNIIDAFDFTIMMSAYDITEDTPAGESDLNNDGMVDAFDFTVLMLNYDTMGDACN